MREHFLRAVDNVVLHGDTDVFPFPFETHLFFDKREDAVSLLSRIHSNFDGTYDQFEKTLALMPPANESLLTAVGYTGFRWATQFDPFWNLYFLGIVISIGGRIETSRIPIEDSCVFSYRFIDEPASPDLFRRDLGWVQFMQHSLQQSERNNYVVVCDIADFYQDADQHRLQNALNQLGVVSDVPARIMRLLENFSNHRSYGLPVGGAAARLLSELLLNQIDRLLKSNGVNFCRFSDDYHLFCSSIEGAYRTLLFLSEKLLLNQGLSLQKSKTRVMTAAEFQASAPLIVAHTADETDAEAEHDRPALDVGRVTEARAFMRLSLRYDPYSPTAQEDYELLKRELDRFDILGMLNRELAKSRVDVALTRKLASAIRLLDPAQKRDAVLSFLGNLDLLYPIFTNVMLMLRDVFDSIDDDETQSRVLKELIDLIRQESHLVGRDVNLAFALRVLACKATPESVDLLTQLYQGRTSSLVRREIILVMAHWNQWYWVSDLRNTFNVMRKGERRAFIVASYILGDEGKHWRDHTKNQFDEFESMIRNWTAEKKNQGIWSVPI